MKVLVTGAAGFVGSAITRRLLSSSDATVLGIDSLSDYYDPMIKRDNLAANENSRFRFVEGDLNTVDLADLLTDVEIVFHQAGQPGVRKSWGSDFQVYTEANIDATQRLLEAARLTPTLKRLVYASSSSIYGNAERYPTRETDRPQPVSPYGVTKLAAEHLVSLYGRVYGLPTVSLRYFTVYGPGQRPDMAFTRFLHSAVTDSELTLYGTGAQVRDFTYIEDVVSANIAAASRDIVPGDVFNIAGGSNVSVNEIFASIESIHKSKLRIRRLGSVAGDVFQTGGDTARASELLGWAPTVTLEQGLQQQYEWIKAKVLEGYVIA